MRMTHLQNESCLRRHPVIDLNHSSGILLWPFSEAPEALQSLDSSGPKLPAGWVALVPRDLAESALGRVVGKLPPLRGVVGSRELEDGDVVLFLR